MKELIDPIEDGAMQVANKMEPAAGRAPAYSQGFERLESVIPAVSCDSEPHRSATACISPHVSKSAQDGSD